MTEHRLVVLFEADEEFGDLDSVQGAAFCAIDQTEGCSAISAEIDPEDLLLEAAIAWRDAPPHDNINEEVALCGAIDRARQRRSS